jgi:hypothetical protein
MISTATEQARDGRREAQAAQSFGVDRAILPGSKRYDRKPDPSSVHNQAVGGNWYRRLEVKVKTVESQPCGIVAPLCCFGAPPRLYCDGDDASFFREYHAA